MRIHSIYAITKANGCSKEQTMCCAWAQGACATLPHCLCLTNARVSLQPRCLFVRPQCPKLSNTIALPELPFWNEDSCGRVTPGGIVRSLVIKARGSKSSCSCMSSKLVIDSPLPCGRDSYFTLRRLCKVLKNLDRLVARNVTRLKPTFSARRSHLNQAVRFKGPLTCVCIRRSLIF